MATWNAAGIGTADLDLFIEQVSDHYPWDVLFLQEAFSRSGGIELDSNHHLIPSGTIVGGLRCPAILVNGTWENVRYAGSGRRWVAVEVDD